MTVTLELEHSLSNALSHRESHPFHQGHHTSGSLCVRQNAYAIFGILLTLMKRENLPIASMTSPMQSISTLCPVAAVIVLRPHCHDS
ncbi:hypothetical protein INR49_028340 [Caranx melampygus]|nr:hypothetical protein INR49_028340 [Caranx melampygus]